MIFKFLFLINFPLFLTNGASTICVNDVADIKLSFESITEELKEYYKAGKYSEMMSKKKKFKENLKKCCLIIKNDDFKNKILANHSICNTNKENSERYFIKTLLKLNEYNKSQNYSEIIDSLSKTMVEDLEYIYTFKFNANLKEKSDDFFTKCNNIIKILNEFLKNSSVVSEKSIKCSMNYKSNEFIGSLDVQYKMLHYIDRNIHEICDKFEFNLKSMSKIITKNTNITEEEIMSFFDKIFVHQYSTSLLNENIRANKQETVDKITTILNENLMPHFPSLNLSEYTLLELLCLKFIHLSYKKKEFVSEYINKMIKSYDNLSKNTQKDLFFEDEAEKRNHLILLKSQEEVFTALIKVNKDIKANTDDSKHNYGFIEEEFQKFLKKTSNFRADLEKNHE